MADAPYGFRPGANNYLYNGHSQAQPKHNRPLPHRTSSPIGSRLNFNAPNEAPSPSRSPGPNSPAYNAFGGYMPNRQNAPGSMLNGNHNHFAAMGMNLNKQFQSSNPAAHSHAGHPTHNDHAGNPSNMNNFLNHQHNLSGGGVGAVGHNFGQNNIANGNSSLPTSSGKPHTEHWAKQLELYQISRDSQVPHVHARNQNNNKAASVQASAAQSHEESKEERNRTLRRKGDTTQEWAEVDFASQGLRTLAPALFEYTFLERLHLNSNKINYLPPAIGRLRFLTHLDMSQNNLQELPPEIGMLSCLKTLLVFDNQIQTLPTELGWLYQLETLGIEGNPLYESIKGILVQEGTQALVNVLKEQAQDPEPPAERDWIVLDDTPDAEADRTTFRVMTFNTLCDRYATQRQYGYTPQRVLQWDHRKDVILDELRERQADIMCLQEVDRLNFEEFFRPALAQNDYRGIFFQKTRVRHFSPEESKLVDGCATFYRASKFILLDKHMVEIQALSRDRADMKEAVDMFNRVMLRDNVATICFFEHRMTGFRMIVANTHLHWDTAYKDVKLVQVALVMDEITRLAEKWTKWPACTDKEPFKYANGDDEPSKPAATPEPSMEYKNAVDIPIIFAGDYNSEPGSSVYDLLSHSHVPSNHEDLANFNYGPYTRDGIRLPFSMKSSYAHIGELEFTNYTPGFAGVLDYVWYSTNSLQVTGLLGNVDSDYLQRVPGFPNFHFPSDHLALLAQFRVKARKDKKGGLEDGYRGASQRSK